MPEQNFEQQARNMVNGFEKEPKPEIWQNVRKAIQQPRRKRRVVLWWWLLPLILIGSGIALYTIATKTSDSEGQIVKTSSLQPKSEGQAIPPSQSAQQTDAKQEFQKSNNKTTSLSQSNNNNHKRTTQKNRAETNRPEISYPNHPTSNQPSVENIAKPTEKEQEITDADNEFKANNKLGTNAASDNQKTVNNEVIISENQAPQSEKDSVKGAIKKQDSAVATIISQVDSSRAITTHKKNKAPKLQWGIIAEAGVAARKSSLLSLTGFEKSTSSQSINDPGSVNSGGQSRGNFNYSNEIKHGAAFGLGIAMQKRINKSVDLFADVAYHYQSFHIATAVYKDSFVLNNLFSSFAGRYKAEQSFHFASLFAGFNWHFINSKPVQLGVSAGLDNLFLLTSTQKLSAVSSSNFSLSYAMQRSDSVFTTSNFYRYQPSLYAGVLVNIKLRKQQLQLVPFARSSIRQLDKNALNNNNNHLFSGGLRAVYFFK